MIFTPGTRGPAAASSISALRAIRLAAFTLCLFPGSAPANSPAGTPMAAPLTINRIVVWANADGVIGYNPARQGPGITYPRGASTVVAREGIVWGGFVRGAGGGEFDLRVGGQTARTGTQPGRILSPGVAENPAAPDVRIFRIRGDWAAADLRRDAAETFGIPELLVTNADVDALRERYRRDWNEWPWDKGAPYYERNGIPGYQPDPAGIRDSLTDEPGLAAADQVIWFVCNDLDSAAALSLHATPPIGLETQVTLWAYDRPGGLGDAAFQKYTIVYKGTATTAADARIDEMHLAKWLDADIGNYSDDFAGYDASRRMMYAYNAEPTDLEFDKVSAVPSLAGYALLQGPRVPAAGETARWKEGVVEGYANLPPAAFTYLDGNTRNGDSRFGDFQGLVAMWNLLRGFQGVFSFNPPCLSDPFTGECTRFELTGDPENFAGWVDGIQLPKGDRRLLLSTGPFTMARGDTQEVVFALAGGVGENNRAGLGPLRAQIGAARDLHLNGFTAPAAIPLPRVRPIELDNKVILDWESDRDALRAAESYDSRGFRFETWELFQLPRGSAAPEEGVPLPAFDPTKPRFLSITRDELRDRPLVNGRKYWFALRARAYNPGEGFSSPRIRSAPVVVEVTPHAPDPGVVYPYAPGELLSDAVNVSGVSEARVNVRYYDPTRPDGHVYKLLFHRSSNQLVDLFTKPWWDLVDSTSGDTLIRGVSMDTAAVRVIGRGFSVECLSPPFGLRDVVETVAAGDSVRHSVFNRPDPGGRYMMVGAGSSYLDTILGGNPLDVDVELRFGDSSWALMLTATAPSSKWVRVPFTAWQSGVVEGDTIERQIYTAITGQGSDSLWRPEVLLDREFDGRTLRVFYPLTIVADSQRLGTGSIAGKYDDNIPWDPVEGPRVRGFLWVNGAYNSIKNAVYRVYIADLDGDGSPAPPGTVVRFERYKLVRNGDVKVFRPEAVRTSDPAAARAAVREVTVFPNPYYGFNDAETDRFSHFVTFSHLPRRAVIRIFNLAGDLVRTIAKDDPSQFATWDLNNHNGLPVGGGLFLAHIEMDDGAGLDLGTAALKLMIVPEKQALQLR